MNDQLLTFIDNRLIEDEAHALIFGGTYAGEMSRLGTEVQRLKLAMVCDLTRGVLRPIRHALLLRMAREWDWHPDFASVTRRKS